MQTYGKFRPTGFDAAGAFLPDQQDWLVLPCTQNRDSEALDESNFAAALAMLGGEGDSVQVHRFGHWGNGWFELILVKPGSEQASIADGIEDRLADYPVLDEEDFCQREHEAYHEQWLSYGYKDLLRVLSKEHLDEYGAAYRYLDDVCTADDLRELFEQGVPSGDYYHSDGINLRSFRTTRRELATFIRAKRIEKNPRIGQRDLCQGSLFA